MSAARSQVPISYATAIIRCSTRPDRRSDIAALIRFREMTPFFYRAHRTGRPGKPSAVALAAETQAEWLQGLEQADAMSTAARVSALSAFTAGQGHSADADYSARRG
jgi:hypothetical protein